MKKLLLLLVLIATSFGAFAQTEKGEKSVIVNLGVQSDPGRLMIGAQGRYVLAENLRLAPDLMFMFPNDKVTGLDVNLNVHYAFEVDKNVSLYPLAGIAMQNNRYSGGDRYDNYETKSRGFTNFGFNLGGGLGYDLGANNFLNIELKYTFSDVDCFTFALGYGFNF